jgi:hypothetical protein
MVYRPNPKTHVDVKNGQLKAIKAALELSQLLVHALMFEVGFDFIIDHLQPQNQSLRRLGSIWNTNIPS